MTNRGTTLGDLSVIRLIALASRLTALTVDEINGRDRARRFVRARMAIVHFAYAAGYSSPQIGRALGGRDHSTILNLRDKSNEWLGRDPLFDRIMDAMDEAVRSGQANREVRPFMLDLPSRTAPKIDYIERGDFVQPSKCGSALNACSKP